MTRRQGKIFWPIWSSDFRINFEIRKSILMAFQYLRFQNIQTYTPNGIIRHLQLATQLKDFFSPQQNLLLQVIKNFHKKGWKLSQTLPATITISCFFNFIMQTLKKLDQQGICNSFIQSMEPAQGYLPLMGLTCVGWMVIGCKPRIEPFCDLLFLMKSGDAEPRKTT